MFCGDWVFREFSCLSRACFVFKILRNWASWLLHAERGKPVVGAVSVGFPLLRSVSSIEFSRLVGWRNLVHFAKWQTTECDPP